MKAYAWLAVLFFPVALQAEDTIDQAVQKKIADPVLQQIGNAVQAGETDIPLPDPGPLNPGQKKAVDHAKTKLIDPLTESYQNTAEQAAKVLGSADANASAPGLEDHAFGFPNQMSQRTTQMTRDILNSHEALSAPAAPLQAGALPSNLRTKPAPMAAQKDFAYRKRKPLKGSKLKSP